MGNKSSSKLDLPDEIDRIASNYILSQNFADMNKLSEKDHCDKLVILTAKIIDKNLNPLEQKSLLKSIINKGDSVKKVEKKEEGEKKEEAEDKKPGVEGAEPLEKKPAEDKKPGVEGLAALRAEPLDKKPAEDKKPGVEGAEPLEKKEQEGGVEGAEPLAEPLDEEPNCIEIAKYYVKIAHVFAAIMKTINPVITATDKKTGKKQKYDLMTKTDMPTDAEIDAIEHNNFCSRRLNNLIQESDYNRRDPRNILLSLKPRFCDMNYDKNTKKTLKFYEEKKEKAGGEKKKKKDDDDSEKNDSDEKDSDKKKDSDEDEKKEGDKKKKKKEEGDEEKEEKEEKGEKKEKEEKEEKEEKKEEKFVKNETPSDSNSEIGIPELMNLYYDEYDQTAGVFNKMSAQMQQIYEKDVATFYKAFTNKDIPTDENGEPTIKRFDQIPLREFHKNEKCKDAGIFTQNYEGSMNDKLYQTYALHINTMLNNMNDTYNKLLTILKQLFKFQAPETIKAEKKEEKKEEEEKKSEKKESEKSPETQGNIVIANMEAAEGGPAVGGPALGGPALGGPGEAVGDKPVGDKPVGDKTVGDKLVGGPGQAVGDKTVGDKPTQVEETAPTGAENKPGVKLTKEEPVQVGGADTSEMVIIHPNLNPDLLQTLVNSTRQLIVRLYVGCEKDFLQGIVLFESIVAMQLAKTTNSQIKLLNDLTTDYLVDHEF
jgi:hypothetical protein